MTTRRASAVVFGAVSVVNAIASGKGATASVKLPTEAKVEIEDSAGSWDVNVNGKRTASPLAVETVKLAIRTAGKDPEAYSGWISTQSAVPMGVGLKTSSASSTAIAIATFAALGHKGFDTKKFLDISVQASLNSGASITGALDDAAGCLMGGISMTDNLARKVVSSKLFERKFNVLIAIPKLKSKRESISPDVIRKFKPLTELFFEMTLKADYWRAMVLNGLTYSSILGYDPSPALRAVEVGALGAGLSGTGPAVAAIFEPSKRVEIDSLAKEWREDGSTLIETETNDEHGRLISVE